MSLYSPEENVFPMVPAGKPIDEILGIRWVHTISVMAENHSGALRIAGLF